MRSVSKNFHIYPFPTKDEATLHTAKAINRTLAKLYKENKPSLLLLSGGSAYAVLSHIDDDVLSEKTTITVLDERYSTDPTVNNMAQLQQTAFFQFVQKRKCHVIDTRVHQQESLDELAARFDKALSAWKNNNPDGEIVALLGIGPDSHTSGILPFPENSALFSQQFENAERIVVGYDAEGKNPYRYRVTTTNTFLRDFIDHSFVYAVGENKKEALSRVLAEDGDLPTTPARILREMKRVDLFTDVTI